MVYSTGPDIVSTIGDLSSSAWTYAGVSAAFELGVVRALDGPATAAELGERLSLEPELVADLLGVLVAIGAVERTGSRGEVYSPTADLEPFRSGSLSRVIRAGIRSDHMQTAEVFRQARDGSLATGWSHRDPDLLVAQGETAGLFRLAAEHVLPALDGLRDRLMRPDARFLDVGAGVGVLSREICLVYPGVAAVCVEPNEAARAIGRERCLESGLEDRIRFVPHGIEEIEAEEHYDLALIPQPFLPPAAFARGIGRVHRALQPGGWLLVLALDLPEGDPMVAASRRIRARLWGGGAIQSDDLIAVLRDAGFDDVRAQPAVGAFRMYAARRPGVPRAGAPLDWPDPISA